MPYHRGSNSSVDNVNAKTRTVYLSLRPPITNTVGMQKWFVQPAVAQDAAGGRHFITDDDVHSTGDFLPDEAVDTSLGHLQNYFSDTAWRIITSTGMLTLMNLYKCQAWMYILLLYV